MSASVRIVALDIGRTNCRIREYDGPPDRPGAATATTTTVGSGATLADPEGPARVSALVAECVRGLDGFPAGRLAVAVAGGLENTAASADLADRLVGLGHEHVVVTGDIVAAHAGCFDGDRGVVLSAGSGAVALGLAATGEATKVDGNGFLLGDAGSGFAIGRAGLDAALRHHDGRPGGSAPLARVAAQRFGPLGTLPGEIHARPDGARVVASFAAAVAEQAVAGDPVSRDIWQQAVAALAETVTAAGRWVARDGRVDGVPVALTGGLLDSTELVADPLRAALRAEFPDVRRADGDALLGAARIAARRASAYDGLLVRRTTSAHKEPEEARR